jgi:hypothetical protein
MTESAESYDRASKPPTSQQARSRKPPARIAPRSTRLVGVIGILFEPNVGDRAAGRDEEQPFRSTMRIYGEHRECLFVFDTFVHI